MPAGHRTGSTVGAGLRQSSFTIPDEVLVDEAERLGFTVVRRCTGGGTMVVQPGGAITYSLYAPRWFVDGLIRALSRSLGQFLPANS